MAVDPLAPMATFDEVYGSLLDALDVPEDDELRDHGQVRHDPEPVDHQVDVDAEVGTSAGAGTGLLDDVEQHLARYVAFPSEHELVAVTLWVAHAHALDHFESTPRLALLSPEPGSGKTRVLEVLDTLTPDPMHVLSASPAALFRSLAKSRRTLLLDEVDAIFGRRGKDENNEDLRALLNAGHRKKATIPRCVGPAHDVKDFEVYAAVALAGLGDLPDTLMTRSVVIRMRRRKPGETVQAFRVRHDVAPGHALRDRLVALVAEVADSLTQVPVMPPGIDDRPADVWEPLLAIADAVGGDWPTRGRDACLALAGASMSREASLGIRLLADLKVVFGTSDKMATAELLDALPTSTKPPGVTCVADRSTTVAWPGASASTASSRRTSSTPTTGW